MYNVFMSLVARILLGLAITAAGAFGVYRTDLLLRWFGRSWWAETKLGGGGSRLLYGGLSLLACLIGIIIATDLFDQIVGGFLMKLFG